MRGGSELSHAGAVDQAVLEREHELLVQVGTARARQQWLRPCEPGGPLGGVPGTTSGAHPVGDSQIALRPEEGQSIDRPCEVAYGLLVGVAPREGDARLQQIGARPEQAGRTRRARISGRELRFGGVGDRLPRLRGELEPGVFGVRGVALRLRLEDPQQEIVSAVGAEPLRLPRARGVHGAPPGVAGLDEQERPGHFDQALDRGVGLRASAQQRHLRFMPLSAQQREERARHVCRAALPLAARARAHQASRERLVAHEQRHQQIVRARYPLGRWQRRVPPEGAVQRPSHRTPTNAGDQTWRRSRFSLRLE